jgi:hypothetical protein
MNEREKELKAFSQCADALGILEKKAILKVFHMLSIHFEVVPSIQNNSSKQDLQNNNHQPLVPLLEDDVENLQNDKLIPSTTES